MTEGELEASCALKEKNNMKYKYKCNSCGKIIETELYYNDEYPKENSLLGLGLYHSDLEVCDTNGNVLGSWNFPALAEMIREGKKTISTSTSICDGLIVSIPVKTGFEEHREARMNGVQDKHNEMEVYNMNSISGTYPGAQGELGTSERQEENVAPDLLDEAINEQEEKAFVPNTKIAYYVCGCEEFIDTELPHSLFRMCNAHREKFIESLEIDTIYGRTDF